MAGVEGRLAAASLPWRELDLEPGLPQQRLCICGGFREDQVGETGCEELDDPGFLGTQLPGRCIAESNAIADGAKSVRRTNASASGAPQSRSIPESSHSIDSGPV